MMSLHFLRSKILVQKTMKHQMNCKFAVCLRASASTNNNKKGCDAFSTEFLWKELNQSIDLEIVFFFCLEIASFVVDSEVRKKKKIQVIKRILENINASFTFDPATKKISNDIFEMSISLLFGYTLQTINSSSHRALERISKFTF